MTAPVTEDDVRALAPVPDQLWPEAERDAALVALLERVGGDVAPDLPEPGEVSGTEAVGPVRRRRWSWGAAVAAAVVVLLVGVGAVLVALHRSEAHDGVGPAATSSPSASVRVTADEIVIPIDHDGAYHYTSPPVPFGGVAVSFEGGVIFTVSYPHIQIDAAPGGAGWVYVVDFTVTSYIDGAEVRLTSPSDDPTGGYSQIGPACEQSSGGCGAATEPGNVRPS